MAKRNFSKRYPSRSQRNKKSWQKKRLLLKNNLIKYLRSPSYSPQTADSLRKKFSANERLMLSILKELAEKNQIYTGKNQQIKYRQLKKSHEAKSKPKNPKRYQKSQKSQASQVLQGKFIGNPKGFAFVELKDSDLSDIFIPPHCTNNAMNDDIVLVKTRPTRKRNKRDRENRQNQKVKESRPPRIEGEILNIIERNNETVIGTLDANDNCAFLIPLEQKLANDIYISKKNLAGARDGDRVIAKIIKWPSERYKAEGKIIQNLGSTGDPDVDMLSVIHKYHLPKAFSSELLSYAEKIANKTEISAKNRLDLRDKLMVTIDGLDAKDLDDAITCYKIDEHTWHLGVHIADVGQYVPRGSILDEEALERGNSTYLPDRVIPMLPPVLSNGVCSLNEKQDRLALSCLMEINQNGKVVKSEICESIINVDKRLTYEEVNSLLETGDKFVAQELINYIDMLYELSTLRNILANKRRKRGSIDFNFPETKIIFDEYTKEVIDLKKYHKGTAESIIEEAMILANEVVASTFYKNKLPFIYRIHDKPDLEKITLLNTAIEPLGYSVDSSGKDGIEPRDVQEIIDEAKGRPEELFVNTVTLRSMSRARYSTSAIGHFGLASRYYSHFTAPIRRYSDLAIHRAMKNYWQKRVKNPQYKESKKEKEGLAHLMESFAEQCSILERNSEEAEREAIDIKRCEFMANHIGKAFTGHISGVANYGLYVELDNTAEGLLPMAELDDDEYILQENQVTLLGRRTKKRYQLGDLIKVKVARVNVPEHQINFYLDKDELSN